MGRRRLRQGIGSFVLACGLAAALTAPVAETARAASARPLGVAALAASEMEVLAGDEQAIPVNTASHPLVIQLIGNDLPLAGRAIHWTTTGGTLSSAVTTTDSNGKASVTLTPTANGEFAVTARFAGDAQFAASQATFGESTTLGDLPGGGTDDQSVGGALDTVCPGLAQLTNPTHDQRDLLEQCAALASASAVSPASAVEALRQISPTVARTQSRTAAAAASAQAGNLAARMQALRGGTRGTSFAGLTFVDGSGQLALADVASAFADTPDRSRSDAADASRWGAFASGRMGRQEAREQANTPGYRLGSDGVTVGVDYRFSERFVLGGAAGYTHQTTDLVADQGSLAMRGWSLSGYATWFRDNDWYVDGSLTWHDNHFDSKRNIRFTLAQPAGGTVSVDQTALASSGGSGWSGALALGRDFHRNATSWGLYGRLQFERQAYDAFAERLDATRVGSGLGLRIGPRTIESVASVVGSRIDWNHSTSWGVLVPHAEAEWQHEFRSDPQRFAAFFVDDPTNTPIPIVGDPTDSDFFRLGAGLSFVMPRGRSAFVLYDRTIGRQGITQYNLSLGFRFEF